MPGHPAVRPFRACVRTIVLLCIAMTASRLAAFSNPASNPTLMTGVTLKGNSNGCASCHGSSQDLATTVTLSGRQVLFPGQTSTYTLAVAHASTTGKVGFDIAADDSGSLATVNGQPTQILNGEIVHYSSATVALPTGPSASVTFNYQLPSAAAPGSVHQLYAVADIGYVGFWRHAATLAVAAAAPPHGLSINSMTGTAVGFSWSGNTPEYRAVYKSGSAPTGPFDGTLVYEGTATSASATGLTPNTRYYLAVYGKDSGTATYTAAAATISFTTTLSQLAPSASWSNRQGSTSQGKALYFDGYGTIWLYNGSTSSVVQTQGALGGAQDFAFTLGSGSAAGHVIGAWRRLDSAWVSVDGGTPVMINAVNAVNAADPTDAEDLEVDSGCVFAVYRAPVNGSFDRRNVYRIDTTTGNATDITNQTTAYGAYRVSTSGCKAVWAFDPGTVGNGPFNLQYYDGSAVTTLDTGVNNLPFISNGKIVYTKSVGGVSQVFLYDTTVASPAPQQLTSYSDATKLILRPLTDGRHVGWIQTNGDGSSPQLLLNGNVPVGSAQVLGEAGFQLNRGQMLWADASGALHDYSESAATIIDSSTFNRPWLADGFAAFLGGNAGTTPMLYSGVTPDDASQPEPPLVVKSTVSGNQVTLDWDRVVGATSYNVYYALQSGITPSNYQTLSGGTRVTAVSPPAMLTLASNGVYSFVVTSVQNATEGPASRAAAASIIGTLGWLSVGNQSATTFYAATSDRSNASVAYAAGGSNVFKTTDAGLTWSALAGGIAGVNVHALAAGGSNVFATAPPAGSIYRSSDGGATWTNVLSGAGVGELNGSVAVDPSNPNTVYAGDFKLPSYNASIDSYVMRSDDGGSTWSALPQNVVPSQTIGIAPPNGPILVGDSPSAAIFLGHAHTTATTVTLQSSDPNVATVPATVPVGANQFGPVGFNITAIGAGTATITATLPASVGGMSTQLSVSVVNVPLITPAISCPAANVPTGTSTSVTLFFNPTSNASMNVSLSSSNASIITVPSSVAVPANASFVTFNMNAIATGSAAINVQMPVSVGGATTSCLATAGPNAPVSVLVLGPNTDLVAGVTASETVTIGAAQGSDTLVTLTSSDPTILTAPASVTIAAGLTSTTFEVHPAAAGSALVTATLPAALGGTFAASFSNVFAPTLSSISAYALAVDPARTTVLYAAGPGTPNVVRTDVNGSGWTDASIPGAGATAGYVYSLAVDPTNSSILYAGLGGGGVNKGVFKSTDGGITWTAMNSGLPGAPSSPPAVNSILADPIDPSLLHLGTAVGYFYSTNGGATWTAANGGLPDANAQTINALTIAGGHNVIAATNGGLYLLSINPAPAIASIAPSIANVAGGAAVTIRGSAFQSGATVAIGGTAASNTTVVDSTTITATAPAHAAGTFDVVVTNFDGRSATLAASFTYTATPAPGLSGVNPTSGPAGGGTSVTISGANFTSGATITFGGTAASNVIVVNASTITATTPAHAAGAVSVAVRNSDGQIATLASAFTYVAPPFVSGVSPSSGSSGGGTAVTISGSGFMGGATVTFGGAAATSVNVASATSITATTPAHAAGAVNVTVLNPDGQSGVLTSGYTYTATLLTGDANGDGTVTVSDVFYLLNYLFASGTAPHASADVNGDGVTNVGDVFYLINYLFAGGPAPH